MKRQSCYFLTAALSLLFLFSCNDKKEIEPIDPEFGKYIFAYTSGVISTSGDIRIQFAEPFSSGTVPTGIFDFDPEIEGKYEFIDANTLVFTPSEKLKSGTVYTGELNLKALYPVEEGFESFKFQFQTIEQNLNIYFDGYTLTSSTSLTPVTVSGKIRTSDFLSIDDLKNSISASQNGESLSITVLPVSDRVFNFEIENVQRLEQVSEVIVSVPEGAFELKQSVEKKFTIPSINDFSVVNATYQKGVEHLISIQFSDPLKSQDLEGLISLEDAQGLQFNQDANEILVRIPKGLEGTKLLEVSGVIKNIAGREMGNRFTKTFSFDPEKPEVRLLQSKSIIPTQEEGLIFAFEAVSLQAVDVYVTKVFENNTLQYLQDNQMGQTSSLYRVGRNIYRKHLDLRQAGGKNLQEWNRFYVDLSEIIKTDPGALYEVDVRFKQEYTTLECNSGNGNMTKVADRTGWIDDNSYFVDDYWDDYVYDWDEYDNPCNSAYYNRYRTSNSRVIMATNLGLIAKLGGDDRLFVAVTDLGSANPLSGVDIEVYDFQQQLISKGKTDSDGFTIINCKREPFAVVARTSNDKSMMKIDGGSSLSLSKFEVEGQVIQDGLKGFIYGERGVWRPGDSLYVNFILEDETKKLPANHPVKMKFFNPRGQLVDMQVRTRSVNGFYDFRTTTEDKSPTGDYRMEITVGNQTFYKRIPVETIKPNRLKVDLNFSEIQTNGASLNGILKAQWLHGMDAANLSADIYMRLFPAKTEFAKFKSFYFENRLQSVFSPVMEKVFDGKLNDQGKKEIKIPMDGKAQNAPGKLKASFETKVYEPGGGFSIDYHSAEYSPYTTYAGLRIPEGELWGGALETDVDHTIEVASVTTSGAPSNQKELEVAVYRIDRRWWFDRYSGEDFNYLNSDSYRKYRSEKVNLKAGKGKFNLTIEKDDWGRYLIHVIDPVSGHSAAQLVFFDWPYWMRANRTDGEAATILGFSSDKETYKVGEEIKVTFPSPEFGRALISVENGTEILSKQWVETQKGETQFKIPAVSGMAPNVYIHISLIQPHSQTENDRPLRMFGLIPITIEDPQTILEPVIQAPELVRPETQFTVSIREKQGKSMTYTLAMVDEGLLDITNFSTPSPHDAFYAHEALGVKTWDYFDDVVGAISIPSSEIMSIGGDEEAPDPSKQKARRFEPVVRYLGPFTLAPGKIRSHKIDMPNYIGSVRIMVVAGQNKAYGNAEKSIPVKSELMVLGTLPRILGPGEKVSLPVNVFAMEKGVKSAEISIETNALFLGKNNEKKTVSFTEPGEKMVYFDLQTAKNTGKAVVKITAKSGNTIATYSTELEVRSPNPVYSTVRDTVIETGNTWNVSPDYFGIKGTNKAVLEVSKLPAINLEKRLDYLIGYPHGCVEQIVSGAFPQIYLENFVDLKTTQKVEIQDNVEFALNNLRNYQLPEGGFSYWPGLTGISDWGTSYAGHFMLAAEERGFNLPVGMKNDWIQFQRKQAGQWYGQTGISAGYEQRGQAYRLLTLALAGEPEFGAMNLLREKKNLNLSARWILALAYVEAGRRKEAQLLIQNQPNNIEDYTELGYTYGSDLRDEAFVLLTLNALNAKKEAAIVAREIAGTLSKREVFSTQTTAMSLMALADYLGQYSDTGLKFNLNAGGQNETILTGKPFVQREYSPDSGSEMVSVKSNSDQPLYAKLTVSGKPVEGKAERLRSNLGMEVKYLNANFEPIEIDRLQRGTDLIVEIKITNPGARPLKEMALNHVFPSGWEILNPRLSGMRTGAEPEYQDIRDDKILSYFDLDPNATITFRVRVNAAYGGRFYLPAIVCNAMYDEKIAAVEPGKWIEVK